MNRICANLHYVYYFIIIINFLHSSITLKLLEIELLESYIFQWSSVNHMLPVLMARSIQNLKKKQCNTLLSVNREISQFAKVRIKNTLYMKI